MPHLVVEVARGAIERRLLGIPIEFGPPDAPPAEQEPVDILAPPAPFRITQPTPFGTIRSQILIRTVQLQAVPGTAQASLMLTFDEGSVEVLGTGLAESLLAGSITIPFMLRSRTGLPAGRLLAMLMVDFNSTVADFAFRADSRAKIQNRVGGPMTAVIEQAIEDGLTTRFQAIGERPAGVEFAFTPGVPSENMFTVEALPGVAWVDAQTLALSLRYAPEPTPPPFQPVPFLPAGDASAFGLWQSNEGFQRTVRDPAVRRLARDSLSDRLLDGFVQQAYLAQGGQGGITEQVRTEGRKLLQDFLDAPGGRLALAAETPAPTGSGILRREVKKVPDPFSVFNGAITELDLWLGQDRIEGRTVVSGEIDGFGFEATVRFRARPVLIRQPNLAIELHDIEIDTPDLSISLPFLLEWAFGHLLGFIAGPVVGAVVGFMLSAVIAGLVEALLPSDLGSFVPAPDALRVPPLPQGVVLTSLDVTPARLAFLGRWSVFVEDPRPHNPVVRITDTVRPTEAGPPRRGTARFTCLGALGIVMDSPSEGSAFGYEYQSYSSRVTLAIDSTAVPLPLTRFPWTIAVGHRSTAQYHFPVLARPFQPLAPGLLAVTAEVWRPEPPLKGRVVTRQFTINVQAAGDGGFVLDIPPEAGCILIEVRTKVIDAAGRTWELGHQVDVPNEKVTFGDDFHGFAQRCDEGRREWDLVEEPSRLDKVWNPLEVYARTVQYAIRTEHTGVTREIASLLEVQGPSGFRQLLAPSQLLLGRTRTGPASAEPEAGTGPEVEAEPSAPSGEGPQAP